MNKHRNILKKLAALIQGIVSLSQGAKSALIIFAELAVIYIMQYIICTGEDLGLTIIFITIFLSAFAVLATVFFKYCRKAKK